MKAGVRRVDHKSYRIHLRQVWTQILAPVILAVIVFMTVIIILCLATLQDGANVDRWAAISTIWLFIPLMIVSLVLFAILAGIIFALAWVAHTIPPYTNQVQRLVYRIEIEVQRVSAMTRKPVLLWNEVGTFIKAAFRKALERT